MLGLVLSGGGARGAYQAGVLQALQEILQEEKIDFPQILSGVSAGAINSAFLAAEINDIQKACHHLTETWSNLKAEDVFKTDYASVTRNALKVIRGVSLGGFSSSLRPLRVGLLNTAPLLNLLQTKVNFAQIEKNISSGALHGLSISATDYSTAFGVSFVMAQPTVKDWRSANRFSVRTQIQGEHILASSAIPLFFPPVEVNGRHFGDGCLRNTAPLSPAVHMGASRLLVVGVRLQPPLSAFSEPSLQPSLGRVLSVLINAIFMDAVEVDLERLRYVNLSIRRLQTEGSSLGVSRMRTIDSLYFSPSKDLSEIAKSRSGDLPKIIRFLVQGLGTLDESAELLSYLLFEPTYCRTLVELGYEDTFKRKEEVSRFINAPATTP